MVKVGLTGNIGSGKTVVSKFFQVLRIPLYNADMRAGSIMEMPSTVEQIIEIFSTGVLNPQGYPDRKKIAEIVFDDKKKLERLNGVLHPLVIADFERWIREQENTSYIIMESAILYETNYSSIFDKIIFVSAPESVRIKRVVERDKIEEKDVKSRIKQQLPEKEKIGKADFVIVNNDKKPLIPQVLEIHRQLLSIEKNF